MRASFGSGGWVAIDGLDMPGPVYVRLRDEGGRWRIAELYLDASRGSGVIEASDIRDLPIRRIEALVNYHGDLVEHHITEPGPDLSTLASYYGTTFVKYDELLAEGNWVAGCLASQLIEPGKSKAKTEQGRPVMRVPHARRQWRGLREADETFRLTSGPTEGLTDEFLHDVARAYAAAVARGERPNVAISEQTRYPVKTAQRWVYTARMRGIIPRGRKGAAG